MTAFRASFADMKLVKTRQTAQLIFEIPLSDFDAAYEVLGGLPNPASERWFAIAALKSPQAEKENAKTATIVSPAKPQSDSPAAAKRDWRALPFAQQAGIHINDPIFAAYLREEHSDEWHETGDADACIKFMCKITSKRELGTNHKAALLWHQIDTSFRAWKALEHA